MVFASLIAFGILVLGWLVLPVESAEPQELSMGVKRLLTTERTA